MNNVELYRGRTGVRIRETKDGLELGITRKADEENPLWFRLQVTGDMLGLIQDAIQDYFSNEEERENP